MIKLIATDLDGTLLRSDKSLPDGFGDVFRALRGRGVTFVAASGRQYANIYNTLAPYADDAYIISDNGSVNGFGAEITESFLMSADKVDAVLRGLDAVPATHPLICTAECGYYTDDDPAFVRELHRYYVKTADVADGAVRGRAALNALRIRAKREDIIGKRASKIAVYCHGRAEELIDRMPEIEGLRHVVSGADWIDFARTDIDKGFALKNLIARLGIAPDDCVAFGDQFNDREMLEACGSAFVTANASAGMRALFPVIGSNDDGAVIKKIRELIRA